MFEGGLANGHLEYRLISVDDSQVPEDHIIAPRDYTL